MNANIFAEWLRRQGHKIFRTPSSFWYNKGPHVYQAFPYHWLVEPEKAELDELILRNNLICLRYSTPLQASQGVISYHAVYESESYELENLGKWARKNVRRGLRNCKIEPISFERLAEEGWRMQLDTLNRQGRKLYVEQESWRRLCLSAGVLPGFEAWGALVKDTLAASVITFQIDTCIYMLYQQCYWHYLKAHVNNALAFGVTQEMILRPQIHSILYGLHSLDAPSSVDEFKFRMGYIAKPVRQRVVVHPWVRPLFNRASHWGVQKLLKLFPSRPTLAKAEGMFRFYLEGQRPLYEQTWPPVLEKQKVQLLRRKSL